MKWTFFSLFVVGIIFIFVSISVGEEKNLINDPVFKMKMNTFLTNFTEVHLKPFEEKCPKEEYIRFAICHNQINNPQLIERVNDKNVINQKYLDITIKKYFGITNVSYEKINDYQYEEPYFLLSPIPFTSIGIADVEKITKISKDMYEVEFAVYPAPFKKYSSNDIAKFLQNLNKDESDVDYMKAKVKERIFEGKKQFILLNYKLEMSMIY